MKRRTIGNRDGGVMMEYVILAVLIAAAVIVAVITFGRAVGDGFFVAGQAATVREKTAKGTLDAERVRRDNDITASKDYHDSMHETQQGP
jgi:Flp pilus assembly pilin Flp